MQFLQFEIYKTQINNAKLMTLLNASYTTIVNVTLLNCNYSILLNIILLNCSYKIYISQTWFGYRLNKKMLGQIDLDFRDQTLPKEQSISKLSLLFWTDLQPQNAIPAKNHTKGCHKITRIQTKLAQSFFTEAYSLETLRFEFRINLEKLILSATNV